jgi:predicted nucleic acid-binding protein
MKYLLDASALLPLVTGHGKQLLVEASQERLVTTELALYEACNGLWKLAALLNTLSLKDAVDTATILRDLVERDAIQALDFANMDLPDTLTKAYEEQLTFYEASYISAACSSQSILVTEDEKLLKVARKFVKAKTYSDFENKKNLRARESKTSTSDRSNQAETTPRNLTSAGPTTKQQF